tara:strand:+ start:6719 stop:6904 length:186 start_codon:yes stop_codon:yes gene_type:complete
MGLFRVLGYGHEHIVMEIRIMAMCDPETVEPEVVPRVTLCEPQNAFLKQLIKQGLAAVYLG